MLLLSLLFLNCTGKQHSRQNDAYMDSLQTRCYELLNQFQTDTLRMAADEYMRATEQYSQHYYKARQFYINSYFNAKDHDKVLEMLDETSKLPHFNEYPVTVCDYQYTRARSYQYSKKYPEAIEAFKVCLATDSEDEQVMEDIQRPVLYSMTQLMNTYFISGKTQEAYNYFMRLKDNPTGVIRKFNMRDVYIHLSYIAMNAGFMVESYRLVDSIFILPLHDPTPEKLFRDYYYASLIYCNDPIPD